MLIRRIIAPRTCSILSAQVPSDNEAASPHPMCAKFYASPRTCHLCRWRRTESKIYGALSSPSKCVEPLTSDTNGVHVCACARACVCSGPHPRLGGPTGPSERSMSQNREESPGTVGVEGWLAPLPSWPCCHASHDGSRRHGILHGHAAFLPRSQVTLGPFLVLES